MASSLQSLLEQRVCVLTFDGRLFVGSLVAFDQSTNIVLNKCLEKVVHEDAPVELVPLGSPEVASKFQNAISDADVSLQQLDFEAKGSPSGQALAAEVASYGEELKRLRARSLLIFGASSPQVGAPSLPADLSGINTRLIGECTATALQTEGLGLHIVEQRRQQEQKLLSPAAAATAAAEVTGGTAAAAEKSSSSSSSSNSSNRNNSSSSMRREDNSSGSISPYCIY
ncbi:hypothetical protein Emed_005621 [Eimeria media]